MFGGPGPEPPPGHRFAVHPSRLFDTAKTRQLVSLFATPRAARDAEWAERFYLAAWNASLAIGDPAVVTGPDGFPYLRLNVPGAAAFKPTALANTAKLCLERATGAALYAGPDAPVEAAEFVIPPGTIDSLMRYDRWQGDPEDEGGDGDGSLRTVTVGPGDRQVLMGSPSAEFLPPYTALALLRHLRGVWGLAEPRVGLIVDPQLRPSRNLVIGRTLDDFPSPDAAAAACRRLSWFLPPGRSIMLAPAFWRVEDMTPLLSLSAGVL